MTRRISGVQPEPQARSHQDRHGYRPADQTPHAQAEPEAHNLSDQSAAPPFY
jgi:hypothetical protein